MEAGAAIASAERDQAVTAARRDAERRAETLRQLADGQLSPQRLRETAELYGLDRDLPYVPFAAVAPAGDAADLAAVLRDSGSTTEHRALVARTEDAIIGIAPQTPRVPSDALVATGPPHRLAEIASSLAEARDVLETARAFDLVGLVDISTLGPLIIVATGADAARRLSDHHFGDADEKFLDIETTVLAFLERDQRVEELAAALHLHRNTVRYRLTRFRELTGLDVRRTRDLITAWWLLTWRQAERVRAGSDASRPT